MKKTCYNMDDAFFGSVTVGERGQIVIPADARAELDIAAGDKLLIMRHPVHHGLQIFKLDSVREFMDEFSASMTRIEARIKEEAE